MLWMLLHDTHWLVHSVFQGYNKLIISSDILQIYNDTQPRAFIVQWSSNILLLHTEPEAHNFLHCMFPGRWTDQKWPTVWHIPVGYNVQQSNKNIIINYYKVNSNFPWYFNATLGSRNLQNLCLIAL